jgi:hypothetical protein
MENKFQETVIALFKTRADQAAIQAEQAQRDYKMVLEVSGNANGFRKQLP